MTSSRRWVMVQASVCRFRCEEPADKTGVAPCTHLSYRPQQLRSVCNILNVGSTQRNISALRSAWLQQWHAAYRHAALSHFACPAVLWWTSVCLGICRSYHNSWKQQNMQTQNSAKSFIECKRNVRGWSYQDVRRRNWAVWSGRCILKNFAVCTDRSVLLVVLVWNLGYDC